MHVSDFICIKCVSSVSSVSKYICMMFMRVVVGAHVMPKHLVLRSYQAKI